MTMDGMKRKVLVTSKFIIRNKVYLNYPAIL